MREVKNWYFDLPGFANVVRDYVSQMKNDPQIRPVVTKTIKEFLVPPIIYIKVELYDAYKAIADKLPEHSYRDAEKASRVSRSSSTRSSDRDVARTV